MEDGSKVRIDYASVDKRPGQSAAEARAGQENRTYTPVNVNDGSKDLGSTPYKVGRKGPYQGIIPECTADSPLARSRSAYKRDRHTPKP